MYKITVESENFGVSYNSDSLSDGFRSVIHLCTEAWISPDFSIEDLAFTLLSNETPFESLSGDVGIMHTLYLLHLRQNGLGIYDVEYDWSHFVRWLKKIVGDPFRLTQQQLHYALLEESNKPRKEGAV